ncbi:MAG: hypothetical protein R3B81_12630 [bacterium]
MRKSLLLLGVSLMTVSLASSANAAGHSGQWGLGLLDSSAPVGVFFGVNEDATLHLGLGFHKYDVPTGTVDLETEFNFLAALEYDIWTGNQMGFGVMPALGFSSMSPNEGDGASNILIGLYLGGHWDPSDAVSFWFHHGLEIDLYSPPVGDSTTEFGTSGVELGSFGATFWIPGM